MAGSFLRGLRQLTIQLTACLLSFQEEIDLSNREHHQILDHIATGALIPVALKGVTYRPLGADALRSAEFCSSGTRRGNPSVPGDQTNRHDYGRFPFHCLTFHSIAEA